MPGNEVGEGVHNFTQESFSQGQFHSQVVEGSWPVVGNNQWAGSQRYIGLQNSNSKTYNQQQTDIERGHSSHSSVPHGLDFKLSTLGLELTKSQSESQHPNLNGYMDRRQIVWRKQNEANFRGMVTEYDHHSITSGGLSNNELHQGNVHENYTTSVQSESSESPVSFDFFGNQGQMIGQQTGTLQSLPRQQSGFGDMQLLQQQAMLRKMQEVQRQQQIQQLEARQQSSKTQFTSTTSQASGSHSPALINSTNASPNTEAFSYPWTTDSTAGNANWLQRVTPGIQGSSNGFRFAPEQNQALSLMNLVPQQVDQSLYGVPVSSTGPTVHQYSSHSTVDKPSMMLMHNYSFPGNLLGKFPDQASTQDGSLVSKQGFQAENFFGHASGQGLSIGMDLENFQQVNSLPRNAPVQVFNERQEPAVPSEPLPEKTAMQGSSQNVVALDPTEEKILFGDDNIWDAFGSGSNMGCGGFNTLNSAGYLNGFPSLQSGSWSALMQSAVAETSSNEVEFQEEWGGLTFQNADVPPGNCQPSTFESNTKQRTILADNKYQMASTVTSGSVPLSVDAKVGNSNQGVTDFQQFVHKFPYGHGEKCQVEPTRTHQASEDGSKWLSRGPLQKPLAEGSHMYGSAAYSLATEMNVRSMPGSCPPRQSASSSNSGQLQNEPNGLSFGETVLPSGEALLKTHGRINKLQQFHGNDLKRMMYEEVGQDSCTWKADSGLNLNVQSEYLNSAMGSPQFNKEDSSLNNLTVAPNSNTARASLENSQQLLKSHHPNNWKQVDSSIKSKGNEDLPKSQPSSVNQSDRDAVKMHKTRNCDKKENSSDSHRSNLSQHARSGDLREPVFSDGSSARDLPGGKQKLSSQTSRRTSGPRKFQYHPMGNLDEDIEPSYGMKHPTHLLVPSQQLPRASYSNDSGYTAQAKYFGQVPRTTDIEKGYLSDLQRNTKGEGDAPSRGPVTSLGPTDSLSDRSVDINTPNNAAQLSHNMLELLHKVDQSKECSHSDGSVGPQQQKRPSTSQGFGLQLAPPSQQMPFQSRASASQGSALVDSSLRSSHIISEVRERDHAWSALSPQDQSLLLSHETSGIPGQIGSDATQRGIQGSFSSKLISCFPHSRNELHNKQMTGACGTVTANQQNDDVCSRSLACQSTSASLSETSGIILQNKPVSAGNSSQLKGNTYLHESVSTPTSMGQIGSSSVHFISSSSSQQVAFQQRVPNAWTNVTTQQQLHNHPVHKFVSSTFQAGQSNGNVVSTLQNQEDQDAQKGGNGPSEFGVNSVDSQCIVSGEVLPVKEDRLRLESSGNTNLAENMNAFQERESIIQITSDACPSNPNLTQREIEAFGRSLKPKNLVHKNYSLLQQMKHMKSAEVDPSTRSLKRLKGADSVLDCEIAPKAGEQIEHNDVVGDSSVQHGEVPSADSKMLHFSGPINNQERKACSQLENVLSQDAHAFSQKDSEYHPHSGSTGSVGAEHSQISPQMAPSWFNQFGTFKNGQMLPVYETCKISSLKNVEQAFMIGKPSASLHAYNSMEQLTAANDLDRIGIQWQKSTPASVVGDNISFAQPVAQDVSGQPLVLARPKKRRTATLELVPWHKEVIQGSRSLPTISMAEVDWAKASNRLIDKLQDEVELVEDVPPVVRHRSRLILTTQLMEQLFHPPLAAILTAEACLNYENMVYQVTRLALGGSCSAIPCSGSYSCVSFDNSKLLSDKPDKRERIGDQHLSELMGDFVERAKKLEDDFTRMEKRATIGDMRIEGQDLEKVSVINRLAKFHGRGQADGAEASLPSEVAANALRPCPQRFVTALPMPRNLPERVQCLSL